MSRSSVSYPNCSVSSSRLANRNKEKNLHKNRYNRGKKNEKKINNNKTILRSVQFPMCTEIKNQLDRTLFLCINFSLLPILSLDYTFLLFFVHSMIHLML